MKLLDSSSIQNKRCLISLGFAFLFIAGIYGQNLVRTDSLKLKINLGMVQEKDQLKTLQLLIETYHDPDYKIKYSEKLIEAATKMDSLDYLFIGYLFKGDALSSKGDYKTALENYNKAMQLASNGNNTSNLAMAYSSIGSLYASLANNKNTLEYYKKSLTLFKSIPDSVNYAFTLQKIGDYYIKNKKPDFASFINFTISKAARITLTGWFLHGKGRPPAHIYESPMVFIFSSPYFPIISSNFEK